ncbi:DSD1 family PLP-dependent enzyme [Mesorhizobium sp. M1C.F.Ca.ET.193.01.1.1]|uniref:alanine racemase n=1 Tax=unclassified Mesorhizobium TaxID=325217 RepID=UPI000FD5799D|nr:MULTISPECIES: alanine racemase [unclassified Mesorhizobium]TGS96375.1 DSD1 family PLP-dependent enzyme [bacterium M00.F.Ca.ET.177.01.1.1]TGQ52085.1 DSD1 family PLP-dependent enzyme [Mesorhizobium sp. M1C.F.Ca.ET.210.01.1.1]TGQ68730.1 DSD1 family PLP-dependent enzyme [Mesorhizobium sp. M1C.F.Ca.ET.212.01.1.1]TGR04106.1 DSD1 family PLP-dependent enzyme [Mesorhizobium sp. M1C.F.Ca.ET.204.01.1.1]TGR24770.1 DSD1 family PLP-dependent enzyme [Mesorhizobium sp. M1C.F.Ca.ET.196.01.1.1]
MSAYFAELSKALKAAEIFRPCLVLDRDRLDGNVALVKERLAPGLAVRLVDKSLPCLPLLSHIARALGANRFMTFHPPVTQAVLDAFPEADLLFGKPMPAGAAKAALTRGGGWWSRVCWLIDSPERLAEYGALAAERGTELRFAFEVDVGLHRGGFANPAEIRALSIPKGLRCEGIMAYEAHAPEIPGLFGGAANALKKASARAAEFVAALDPDQRRILNIGGSKTALLHGAGVANEVSIGSAFVLPKDFDTPGLQGLQPAAFIATPILKAVDAMLPGPAAVSRMLQAFGLFPPKGCYLYGGKWMAEPVFPDGMKPNGLIGLSSNQQFMGLPAGVNVRPGDYAFLRPTQSEAVLQHFGSIAVFAGGRIVEFWPALPMG